MKTKNLSIKKYLKTVKLTNVLLVLILLTIPFFPGCDCKKKKRNIISSQPPQGAPIISKIVCIQDALFPQTSTQCRVVASDPEGDLLTYSWSDDIGGKFSTKASDIITYTAPAITQPTKATLIIKVSDGKTYVTQSKQIDITIGSSLSQEKLNVITENEANPLELISTTDDIYTFRTTGVGSLPEIKEGEYIIGSAKGGYIRKVVSVEQQTPDVISVKTEQSALDEIVENASFTEVLDFSNAQFTPKLKGAKNLTMGYEVVVGFSNTTLYEESGIKLSIPSGKIRFNPQLTIDGQIEWFNLKYFHTSASGKVGLDLQFQGSANTSFKKEVRKTVARFDKPFLFFIGVVPVAGVASLVLDLGANLDASISNSVNVPISSSAEVKMGAEYKNGKWSPIAERNFNCKVGNHISQLNGNFVVRAFVEPRIEVMFYNIAGPYISLGPYGEFNSQLTNQLIQWKILAGVYSDAGIKVEFLSYKLAGYNVRLFDLQVTLLTGSISLVGKIQASSDPPSAKIFLNNVEKGITPLVIDGLSPGSYNLKLTKDGRKDWTGTVNVVAGQTTTVNITLEPLQPTEPNL